MLTQELYKTYKARGYTDQQICRLAGIKRSELAKFKPKPVEIPSHLMKKAQELGIHPDTVKWRMEVKHWTAEQACTTPKEESTVTMEQLKKAKRKYGLAPSTIYRRIARGMDVEQALTTPSNRKKRPSTTAYMQNMSMRELVKKYRYGKNADVSVYEFIEGLRTAR
jgi:hypothetical protein